MPWLNGVLARKHARPTSSGDGLYYSIIRNLCKLINRGKRKHLACAGTGGVLAFAGLCSA